MLFEALSIVRDELQYYIRTWGAGMPSANVVLENVALLETSGDTLLSDAITISLVNIEEESTLKNTSHLRPNGTGGLAYTHAPIFLNLYLLFCANFTGGQHPNNNYLEALRRLSLVIQFFQSRKQFSIHNSPNSSLAQDPGNFSNPQLTGLELSMELYTLTFEQINHLWGSLGGRQIPFVMFKSRLVAIQERAVRNVGIVEEIDQRAGGLTND